MSTTSQNDQQTELLIIQAKQSAEFALTPVGQMAKQFEITQRMAQMWTQSTIIPDIYKGNLGNCAIALDMAMRMNANPLMVMQNLYIVHGNPSFSSKFLVATINASGRFSPLRYEFKGEEGTPEYGCRCVAYEKSDKEHNDPLYGDWITIKMADDEGWSKKSMSKWKTMPSQMLRYRASAFWQRVYCPEISMGLITTEEYQDIEDIEYTEVKSQSTRVSTTPEKSKEEQEQYFEEAKKDPSLAPEYLAQDKISNEMFDEIMMGGK